MIARTTKMFLGALGIATVVACSSDPGNTLNTPSTQNDTSNVDPGSSLPTGNGGSGGSMGGNNASTGGDGGADGGGPNLDAITDPLYFLPQGQKQLTALCARNLGDAVSKAFCSASTPPVINSLVDLQKLLGLDFKPGNTSNGRNGNPGFALTGHSSSLVGRFVTSINPRAIIFTPPRSTGRVNSPQPLNSFVAMGFVRGEQFVELISNDPTNGNKLNFFLFKFQHACDATPEGCSNADVLTPAVESNFSGVYSLYNEEDIKNTIFDCQQCHQTGGPGSEKILRMQELQNPWGHFFRNNRTNGQVLLADYATAHDTSETYAGIPGNAITNSDPAQLEGLVENQGFQQQPNEYNTSQILSEVQKVNPNQPGSNTPMGSSPTWSKLYALSLGGQSIPPPYHDIKVTDPSKLQSAATAYKSVMAGTMPGSQLPDIRDIFLDQALSDLSFRPAPNQSGAQILTQQCQQCHNSNLDQSQTRERFRVDDLANMTAEEKKLAIHRLQLPRDSFRKMPPPRFRELSDAEIQLVVDELSK
jgi:mono/diheme cytochrome c family protein